MLSVIFLTLVFPRMANSRPQNAAALKPHRRSGLGRSVHGVSLLTTIPHFHRLGAKARTLSGRTMASTFRDGFSPLFKWIPARNIPWSFSSMADLQAPRHRSGPLRLECREPLLPLSHHEVTTC